MKQVLQHARTGEVTVEEVPAPSVQPGCVLVRVAASVVSAGTERASSEFARKNLLQKARSRPDLVREVFAKVQRDGVFAAMQSVRSRLDQPQSPGYSSSGTVVALGEGITDLRPGDRVSCAGAGFAVHAEMASIPRLLVARIPSRPSGDEVSFDEAAFATLGAVALHGIRTAEAQLGDLVAVIGLGLLGQLTVQLLRAAGCRVLGMDLNPARCELAHQFGAHAVSSSGSAFRDLCLEMSNGLGVDCVLITAETASSEPVNLAGAIARDRAIITAVGTVGIDIERKAYYEKELDFRISRSYGPGRYDAAYEQKGRDYPIGYVRWTETRNMDSFLQLLAEQKVDVASLITHRFPIERARSAYDLITGEALEPFLGVVIQYPGQGDFTPRLELVPRPAHAQAANVGTSRVSVGLLGAGGFATSTLIPAMKGSSSTLLAAVCAATGSHAQSAARKFGFAVCATDERVLMDDPSVNTVVIATRHHWHARQVLASLARGKHVFCEKPLCLSEAELSLIAQAYLMMEPDRRPSVMVGFNRRFAPMTIRLKSFFAQVSEPLALHYRINAGYLPPDHWVNDREQGGGRILGEVCHFVDLLSYLANALVVEVKAHALDNSQRYSGDNVFISLRFANGSQGSITYLANGDRSFSKERLEIFSAGRAASLEDFRRLELAHNGRKEKVISRWRQDKGHAAEWTAFADSITQERSAPIPFDVIVGTTLATLKIEESLATGQSITVDSPGWIDHILHPPQSKSSPIE